MLTPPAPELKPVMTYISTRNPQWKQHKNMGQAKTAVVNSLFGGNGPGSGWYSHKAEADHPIQVLTLRLNGEWKLLWEIPRNISKSELPWNKEKSN